MRNTKCLAVESNVIDCCRITFARRRSANRRNRAASHRARAEQLALLSEAESRRWPLAHRMSRRSPGCRRTSGAMPPPFMTAILELAAAATWDEIVDAGGLACLRILYFVPVAARLAGNRDGRRRDFRCTSDMSRHEGWWYSAARATACKPTAWLLKKCSWRPLTGANP